MGRSSMLKLTLLAVVLLVAPTYSSASMKMPFTESATLDFFVGKSKFKAGYITRSRGDEETGKLGDPTSTLKFTGSGLTYSARLNMKLFDRDFRLTTSLTPSISNGDMVDSDFYHPEGAAQAEERFAARQQAQGNSTYKERENPPLMWSQTVHTVDDSSSAIAVDARFLIPFLAEGRHQISGYHGLNVLYTDWQTTGSLLIADPYGRYGRDLGDHLGGESSPSIDYSYFFVNYLFGLTGEYSMTPAWRLMYEVHLSPIGLLRGEDVHHDRTDLKQNPSITMSALSYAYGASMGVAYRPTRSVSIELNASFAARDIYSGVAEYHYVDGRSGRTMLKSSYHDQTTPELSLQINQAF